LDTRPHLLALGLLFCSSLFFLSCGRKGPPVVPEVTTPAAVEKPSAVSRGGWVYLSWAKLTKNLSGKRLQDLMEYEIYRREVKKPEEKSPAVLIARVKATLPDNAKIVGDSYSYLDDGGENGLGFDRQYAYHLKAVNFRKQAGPPSKELLVTIFPCPLPPSNLKAGAGDGTVWLSWEAPQTTGDGKPLERPARFHIYRGKDSGSYGADPINPRPLAGYSYQDEGLANDVGYFYVVRALQDEGPPWHESLDSNEATAIPTHTTPPSRPRHLTFVLGPEEVRLAWDPNPESDLLGYFVYRSLHPKTGYIRLTATPVTTVTYVDQSASPHATYYYAVSAVDSSPRRNESDLSEPVEVEVP
jgi:hypothetical protein